MRFSDGTRLGSYEILSALGAGGMGEVYRARDTKLDRDVAIKVLPAVFVSDPERIARFQREAKTLAALNHPNIGGIYGLDESDGIAALVLELVPGPTLADRIAQGPIPLADALPIAKQIADALEVAHENGIMHRDLKPPNIKLRPDGTVKVLDFGLAKLETEGAGQARRARHDVSQSSTLTASLSLEGKILGTAPYMSPEQARGHAVDKRTDIWAFGCVLYEMLTGHSAFRGATIADTLAAIVERDPDWQALPASTPQNIRRLLKRCLQKDSRHRLRDIGDARIEIADALSPIEHTVVAPRLLGRVSRWAPWLLVAIAVGGVAYERFASPARSASGGSTGRFVEGLPEGTRLAPAPALAVSPDGRRLAYVVIQNGTRTLYVRDLDQIAARPLLGTEDADQPFFSPDGRWIGFFAEAKLKKVSVVGRSSVVLGDAPSGRGGSWGPDDSIVFAPSATSVLLRVSATDGGTPEPVTTLDRTLNEGSHRWPYLLPGGDAILFAAGPTVSARGWNEAHLIVQSLKTGARRLVAPHGTYPSFASSGHLVFLQDGVVYRQPFDLARLDVTGEAVPVLERVVSSWHSSSINGGSYDFALSASGTLAYLPDVARAPDSMVWVDRRGAARLFCPGQWLHRAAALTRRTTLSRHGHWYNGI